MTAHCPSECSYKVCAKGGMHLRGKIASSKAGVGTVTMERRADPHLSALEFNELQPILTPNCTTVTVSLHKQHMITELKFARCSLGILDLGCPNPATSQ